MVKNTKALSIKYHRTLLRSIRAKLLLRAEGLVLSQQRGRLNEETFEQQLHFKLLENNSFQNAI